MTTRQTTEYHRRGYLGTALVTLGSLALVADLAFFAESLRWLIAKLPEGFLGILPTLALSLLQAIRAIAFDQVDYFSLIPRILVLFTAMLSVIIGIALLRSPYAPAAGADPLQEYLYRGRESDNG